MKSSLERPVVVRLSESDRSRIDVVAKGLGLTRSEILRRSLRIALPILAEVSLPGTTEAWRKRQPVEAA